MRYLLKTLGCKANLYDSQILERELQKKGWTPFREGELEGDLGVGALVGAELCVINSCTVTDEADRQTRKLAQRLARENPNAKVVVTGCGAEVDPEGLKLSPGVHYVVGNQNKHQLVDLVMSEVGTGASAELPELAGGGQILGTVENYAQILSKHPTTREWPAAVDSFSVPPTHSSGHTETTRAFLKIQEGCNSFCTFCIIPYGRGPSRSLRPRQIVQQIRELVAQGIREVVITGTNIGDYGVDWATPAYPMLGDLLSMILQETSLERLRVSSLDPTEITPQILDLMRNQPRFCPHFHISLQSPHSRILRLMKRGYGFEQVKECLEKIAEIPAPVGGVFVGMDLITGFPGETEEEFRWSVEALSMLPWSRLHVFPYSERKGTPATRLPSSVPQHIRVRRSRELNRLSLNRMTEKYRKILAECQSGGLTLDAVLMERQGEGQWRGGYTPNYLRVLVPSDKGSVESERSERKEQQGLVQRNQLVKVTPMDVIVDSKAQDVALVAKVL